MHTRPNVFLSLVRQIASQSAQLQFLSDKDEAELSILGRHHLPGSPCLSQDDLFGFTQTEELHLLLLLDFL